MHSYTFAPIIPHGILKPTIKLHQKWIDISSKTCTWNWKYNFISISMSIWVLKHIFLTVPENEFHDEKLIMYIWRIDNCSPWLNIYCWYVLLWHILGVFLICAKLTVKWICIKITRPITISILNALR